MVRTRLPNKRLQPASPGAIAPRLKRGRQTAEPRVEARRHSEGHMPGLGIRLR